MKQLFDKSKGVMTKAGDWLVESPPQQALTEQEIKIADEHIAALSGKGYGYFTITGVEEDRQALFADYFFRESQKSLVQNKFHFVLIKAGWDFARHSDEIAFPIAKSLYENLKEKNTIVEVMGNNWTELKKLVDSKDHQVTIITESGGSKKLTEVHGTSYQTGAEVKGTLSVPPATIGGGVNKSVGGHAEKEESLETHYGNTEERKINPPGEEQLLNKIKSFLEKLSQQQITFYYDWLEEVRKTITDKDTLEKKIELDPRGPLNKAQRKLGCFGCLIAPIIFIVGLFMGSVDLIAPLLRKFIRKNPNVRGNPFGVNSVRPLFILEAVKGTEFSKSKDAIGVLKSILNSQHAIFLVFTDVQTEKKLKAGRISA